MSHWAAIGIPQSEAVLELTESFLASLKREDRMVEMKETDRIRIVPIYHRNGLAGTSPRMFLREALSKRIHLLSDRLPDGMGFVLLDGYRSPETQDSLFDWVMKDLRQRYPDWADERLEAECELYVARPGDNPKYPVSPHLSGGAIDLALMSLDTGELLEHGSEFDEPVSRSHTAALESGEWPELSADQLESARTHRRILFNAMKSQGFTNYRREWWHYDLGDEPWAQTYRTESVFKSAEADVRSLLSLPPIG
jgi:D-alanyl-D-alanine dipeptidase